MNRMIVLVIGLSAKMIPRGLTLGPVFFEHLPRVRLVQDNFPDEVHYETSGSDIDQLPSWVGSRCISMSS